MTIKYLGIVPVNMNTLDLGKPRSDYEKVKKGISLVETLLTNHELMFQSWRLDEQTNEKQVRDHLVHMRRVFMQRSIVFCRKQNAKILFETRALVRGSLVAMDILQTIDRNMATDEQQQQQQHPQQANNRDQK